MTGKGIVREDGVGVGKGWLAGPGGGKWEWEKGMVRGEVGVGKW